MTTETPQTLEQTILQTTTDKKPQTINQLIEFIQQTTPASKTEILNTIIKLQNQDKLKLTTPQPEPANLSAFLKTSHVTWFWITIALTYAAAIAVLTIPPDMLPLAYVRNVMGIIFILWTPGYAFVKALFPTDQLNTANTKELDTIERIALSIGLSLALVPIIGLLLNYTPWGITLTPIVLSLAAFTTIFALAAIIREQTALIKEQQQTSPRKP